MRPTPEPAPAAPSGEALQAAREALQAALAPPPPPSPTKSRWSLDLPWASLRHRMSHKIRPWVVLGAVAGAGAAAHQADAPVLALAGATPLIGAAGWWLSARWLARNSSTDETGGRRAALIGRRARYAGWCATGAGSWITAAAEVGVDPGTLGGKILWTALAAGTILAAPYWAYHRIRTIEPVKQDETPTPERADADDLQYSEIARVVAQIWEVRLSGRLERQQEELAAAHAAASGTKAADRKRKTFKLADTWLEGFRRVEGGWSAIACCPPGEIEPDKWEGARAKIAGVYSVASSMVTVVVDPTNNNRALVMVQKVNPLSNGRTWDGQGIDPETGRAATFTAADGRRLEHEFWRPGWGGVMELIAGSTGSGKSEYLNFLLALERKSPLIVSWVCDPQLGQSLGDIRDGIDWFAPTAEECVKMLRATKRYILAQSVTITRLRVDEVRPDGRTVKRRVKFLPPSEEYPLVSVSIDEAHLVINDPEYGPEIVALLAFIAKTGRKVNVKLRILLQSPLLSELKSSVLRSQLRQLVTVFRLTDALDGATAWSGKMPLNPREFPALWPDGTNAAGLCIQTGQPAMMLRADYVGDIYDLMTTGTTSAITGPMLNVLGPDYTERAARLAAFDLIDPAELMGLREALEDADEDAVAIRRGGHDGRTQALLFLHAAEGPQKFSVIAQAANRTTRQMTTVCKKLLTDELVTRDKGIYTLTPKGAAAAAALADEDDLIEDDDLILEDQI